MPAGDTPLLAGNSSSGTALERMFTGEQTAVEQFAVQINASWHKSTESTFELAKHCAATNKELSAAAKKALMARLPFDRVTFSKLVKIGNDARLPRLMHQLPPSFSSLYEIAGFDETREPAVTVVGTP